MKLFMLALAGFGLVTSEQYDSKYDHIDVDEILGSQRLLKNYFNCIMERGPCGPDAAELKRILPDGLQTGCQKCTEKQKESTKKIVRHLINQEPDLWKEVTVKYDPEGVYYAKFKAELN